MLLIGITYAYALATDRFPFLPAVFAVVALFPLIAYLGRLVALIKQRSVVKAYIREIRQIRSHRLELSSQSFTLIQDNTTNIYQWNTFIHATLRDNYIYLEGKDRILVPSKSMTAAEFELLTRIIRERLNNNNQQITP